MLLMSQHKVCRYISQKLVYKKWLSKQNAFQTWREITDNLMGEGGLNVAKTYLFGLFITQQLIQYWF